MTTEATNDLKRIHLKLARVCHELRQSNIRVQWTAGHSLGRPMGGSLSWVEDLIMECGTIASKYGPPIDDGLLEAARSLGKSSPPTEGELWAMRAARATLDTE